MKLPGFIDIHTHGCAGYDFSTASVEEIAAMLMQYARFGVTGIAATTLSMAPDDLRRAMKNIGEAIRLELPGARILGINMEGPFIGKDKKGAHDENLIEAPDWELFRELDELSGGNIRIVDVDPRAQGAMEFISRAAEAKKVVSLAHSSATYADACEAFERGATNVTHLFNAMNPLHHREPGIIGAFTDYSRRGVTAELICDGFHIHEAIIRLMFRLCGEQIVLISDSMSAAGMPDGSYELGGLDVRVAGGKAVLADNPEVLAGSVTNVFDCYRNALKFGVPQETALNSVSALPLKILGLEPYEGDWIVVNDNGDLQEIYKDFVKII